MYKISIELKKWNQDYTTSQQSVSGTTLGQLFLERLLCRATLVRSAQFLVVTLFACGLFLLNLWVDDGVRLLVTLAATSGLVYIGLAVLSQTRALIFLNLLAAPILFATAYAGMTVAAGWLVLSFLVHGSITGLQLSTVDSDLRGGLFCWVVFNAAMALLLLLA